MNDVDDSFLQAIKGRLTGARPPSQVRSRDQRARIFTRGRHLGLVFQQPASMEQAAALGLRNIAAADRSELVQHVQDLPGARLLFEALPDES